MKYAKNHGNWFWRFEEISRRSGPVYGPPCILYGSRLSCTDPEVKRSKIKVTRLRKPSRSHGCYEWLLWPLCYCCRRARDSTSYMTA